MLDRLTSMAFGWHQSREVFFLINQAMEEVIHHVADGFAEDVDWIAMTAS